jgi:hypothetical protein
MLRAAWAMLYAHFEGFCVVAFTRYLDELEAMKIVRGHCEDEILKFSLQHHLPKARHLEGAEFVEFLQGGFAALLNSSIEFPRLQTKANEFDLKGRSNMSPMALAECCRNCCVPCTKVNAQDRKLWVLVSRRNEIAHGKDTPVRDADEYVDYEQHVIDVMEAVAKAVDDALIQCKYLKCRLKAESTARIAERLYRASGGDHLGNWFEAERRLSEGEKA